VYQYKLSSVGVTHFQNKVAFTSEIKHICFRFVSDEIVLFQFYFGASYI